VKDLTEVVDTVAVIGMIVGPDDGIDRTDPGRQQLLAHVGAGIDQNSGIAMLDQGRTAHSSIAWLGRIASPPIIADPRHA
jgi:hypothetical protein